MSLLIVGLVLSVSSLRFMWIMCVCRCFIGSMVLSLRVRSVLLCFVVVFIVMCI